MAQIAREYGIHLGLPSDGEMSYPKILKNIFIISKVLILLFFSFLLPRSFRRIAPNSYVAWIRVGAGFMVNLN